MVYKLLQLNIYKGFLLEKVIEFINKNRFDIVCLQEVSGGIATFGQKDCYKKLVEKLNMGSDLSVTWRYKNEPDSYFGNAIFYKRALKVKNKKIIWLKDYQEVEFGKENWAKVPRSALSLDFKLEGKIVTVVTTHLTRGPSSVDKPYKTKQANILLGYLKTLKNPFILTGDFNLNPQTQTVNSFSQLAQNLIATHKITNTLNPRTHRIKELFPKGVAVDYIFVSEGIRVVDFGLANADLSDHLGLSLTFEV